ncbi:hypothetical protein ACLKA7_005734 [Drosophila subpalustris]
MDIPNELKRCKACTDLTGRCLANRLTELRIQTKRKLSEMGVVHIDGKSPVTSYSESVKRLRQALSNYVKLEDDSQTQPIFETAPDISAKRNKHSNGHPYMRNRMFLIPHEFLTDSSWINSESLMGSSRIP